MTHMKKPEPKPRGRPKLKDALSGAERAAKYRAKKAAEIAALKRDVTAIKPVAVGRLEGEIILLNSQLLAKGYELEETWNEISKLKAEIASLKDVTSRKINKGRRC
jgi:hypothetical protein